MLGRLRPSSENPPDSSVGRVNAAISRFTPEELAELAAFDAIVESQSDYDPQEVEEARLMDQSIRDEWADPKRLRKRKKDRAFYLRNKERILARNREYAAAHADEIKAYQQRYYEDHKEDFAERRVAYAAANKEAISERNRKYHESHKEEKNAYSRQYLAEHREENKARSAAWRKANPERSREIKRAWWEKHKDEINAKRREKHAAKKLEATA